MTWNLQPYLNSEIMELRPLKAEDFEALYAVASDPLVWEQHPHKERYQKEVFKEFFNGAMRSEGALVAILKATGEVMGSSRYYDADKEIKQIAIGYTFLARKFWGSRYNQEMKKLMLDHAFQFVDSVIFHIGDTNIRSQKAIQKTGARLLKKVENHLPNGTPFIECIYQITCK